VLAEPGGSSLESRRGNSRPSPSGST
jgi:hypothetical protein